MLLHHKIGLIGLFLISVLTAADLKLERDPFDPRTMYGLAEKSSEGGPVKSLLNLFSKTKSTLLVKGIIWDETDPFAIVIYKGLRQVVRVGDSIDDKKVKDILKEKVIIHYNDQTVSLMVGEDITL